MSTTSKIATNSRTTITDQPTRRTAFTLAGAALATLTALPAAALAQDTPGATPRRVETIRRVQVGPGGPMNHMMGFTFTGDALGASPIKGAPFSATAVTEMEQPLADGNRIRQKSSSALARDSAGRTRRELVAGAIGPLVAPGEPRSLISLHDPVSGTSITLDPTARKAFRHRPPPAGGGPQLFELPLPPPPAPGEGGPGARKVRVEEDIVVMASPPGAGAAPVIDLLPHDVAGPPVRESLGTQMIEGVKAEGTRSTLTIPAGKVGNERPLVVTSERWFSPELGVVVKSRHSDPRLGTSTYQLTGIDRREPPAAQFEVPADYAVSDGPAVIQRRIERRP